MKSKFLFGLSLIFISVSLFAKTPKISLADKIESNSDFIIMNTNISLASNDAGISSVIAPSGLVCNVIVAPQVEITNFGTNTLTSVNINYSIDTGNSQTFSWSGSLAPGESTIVSLPNETFFYGDHVFNVTTSNPNGTNDGDTSNDGGSYAFTSQIPQLFYQDADGDGFGNPNISVQDCDAPEGFVVDNTDCDDSNGQAYPGSVPDLCGCSTANSAFELSTLTHSGSGSTSSTLDFGNNDKDVSFTISNLGSKSNGKASGKYTDEVTVTYVDGNGATQTYGVFTGDVQNSVNVEISGVVQSVTVSLSNTKNTNKSQSIDCSEVAYCSGTPPCPDADGDGVCDADDACPDFDDNLIGTSCTDNDICTINDIWGSDCLCAGTYADSDGDGVCDGEDVCPGGDDTIDSDENGIPDACDLDCTVTTSSFNDNPLTHSGGGSSSTTLNFPTGTMDVSFSINGLNAKTNGKPKNKYIEQVTVSYVDGSGSTIQEGVYSGSNTTSVSINIPGDVQSVTVTLEDTFDGDTGTVMSVSMTDVTSCVAESSSPRASINETQAQFFPNPAKETLNLKLDQIVDFGKVELVDLMGRMIYSKDIIKEQSLEISLTELNITQDVIFAVLKIEGEQPRIQKIILLK